MLNWVFGPWKLQSQIFAEHTASQEVMFRVSTEFLVNRKDDNQAGKTIITQRIKEN